MPFPLDKGKCQSSVRAWPLKGEESLDLRPWRPAELLPGSPNLAAPWLLRPLGDWAEIKSSLNFLSSQTPPACQSGYGRTVYVLGRSRAGLHCLTQWWLCRFLASFLCPHSQGCCSCLASRLEILLSKEPLTFHCSRLTKSTNFAFSLTGSAHHVVFRLSRWPCGPWDSWWPALAMWWSPTESTPLCSRCC